MASRTKSKATPRAGRPPKSPSGATLSQINLRLIASDKAILKAIQEREQARVDALGLPMNVSPADALRILLRSEGKRLGIVPEASAVG